MRVHKVIDPVTGQTSWTVVGPDHLPVDPVESFLVYLVAIGRSPNTVRTYAYALAQYMRFLEGSRLRWREVRLEDLAAFVTWLRRPVDDHVVVSLKDRRSANTVNKTLAAVSAFYDYHVINGCEVAEQLTVWRDIAGKRYKPFLHHVSKGRPVRRRALKVQPTDRLPQVLQPDQVAAILAACRRRRDLFLFALLFETGMRIGQALGLRHEDMTTWDGTVRIVPRDDNANGARAKTRLSAATFVEDGDVTLGEDVIGCGQGCAPAVAGALGGSRVQSAATSVTAALAAASSTMPLLSA